VLFAPLAAVAKSAIYRTTAKVIVIVSFKNRIIVKLKMFKQLKKGLQFSGDVKRPFKVLPVQYFLELQESIK
jgi:hypothetical protein